jgi:phospholipid/cholesterol/gamma-HCH transport system permease protein
VDSQRAVRRGGDDPAHEGEDLTSTNFPRAPDRRPTQTFPVVQRQGIRFFRRISRTVIGVFLDIGHRVFFARDVLRAFGDPATYVSLTIKQMRNIGVDSLPIAAIVAAFIGAVTALQTRYQLFPGIQLSVVGFITRQMLILELGPLLTALVLTGRVGARMTAEIGTMRVTEQIDALETLAYDPLAYLVVPRLLAALVMLPVLTVMANAIGVFTAFMTAVAATDVTWGQFQEGLRLGFQPFQVFYSLIKAFFFGGAIAFICSYEGYITEAGAEGVGRSTARAVVITSVAILLLDALTATYLAPQLQS